MEEFIYISENCLSKEMCNNIVTHFDKIINEKDIYDMYNITLEYHMNESNIYFKELSENITNHINKYIKNLNHLIYKNIDNKTNIYYKNFFLKKFVFSKCLNMQNIFSYDNKIYHKINNNEIYLKRFMFIIFLNEHCNSIKILNKEFDINSGLILIFPTSWLFHVNLQELKIDNYKCILKGYLYEKMN